jgi:hypothetical protein
MPLRCDAHQHYGSESVFEVQNEFPELFPELPTRTKPLARRTLRVMRWSGYVVARPKLLRGSFEVYDHVRAKCRWGQNGRDFSADRQYESTEMALNTQ